MGSECRTTLSFQIGEQRAPERNILEKKKKKKKHCWVANLAPNLLFELHFILKYMQIVIFDQQKTNKNNNHLLRHD